VSSTLLGPTTTYCFSFEISWGALCDKRASFRDGVKERRTKGYCERHNIIIIIIIIGKQKVYCCDLSQAVPFVLLVKVKDED